MINLLEETLEDLSNHNKTPNDVLYVASFSRRNRPPISFSWDQFAAIASFEYDNGFGGQEISDGLMVVGSDWWLERGEYDGSEWWEFKTMPVQPPSGAPCEQDLREEW